MSLFDPDMGNVSHHARNEDRQSARVAAHTAMASMGKHKRIVMTVLARQPEDQWYTARQIGEACYHGGYITLHQIDTIRRRVHDLAVDGWLHWRDNGADPLTFRMAAEQLPVDDRMPAARSAEPDMTPTPCERPDGVLAAAVATCEALRAYMDAPDLDAWDRLRALLEVYEEAAAGS